MADEKTDATEKKTPLTEFRKKLVDKEKLKDTVLEGLKSTNAKVRSLAIKAAFRLKDHDIVKKNVLPLINSDKSKKVLRTVSEKITRKGLAEKIRKMVVIKKTAAPKAEESAAAAPAAAEEKKA